jgi:hypothetical protein
MAIPIGLLVHSVIGKNVKLGIIMAVIVIIEIVFIMHRIAIVKNITVNGIEIMAQLTEKHLVMRNSRTGDTRNGITGALISYRYEINGKTYTKKYMSGEWERFLFSENKFTVLVDPEHNNRSIIKLLYEEESKHWLY